MSDRMGEKKLDNDNDQTNIYSYKTKSADSVSRRVNGGCGQKPIESRAAKVAGQWPLHSK